MSAMLHAGYRFPVEKRTFNTAARVQGFDVQTWTLGAMLDMAQSIPCTQREGGEPAVPRAAAATDSAFRAEVAFAAPFFGLGAGLGLLWFSAVTRRRRGSAVASMA